MEILFDLMVCGSVRVVQERDSRSNVLRCALGGQAVLLMPWQG